jgi:RNA polymerase sigma-70 factor (sigma-E family)
VKSESEREFTAFVSARGQALLRAAHALCGDRYAAEDLVQTALAKAASRWSGIRGEPEPYVRAVLYREFVSGWRKRRRRAESVVAAVPEGTGDRRDHAEATVNRLMLRDLIDTLPPRQRAVIVLRYLEDVSIEEAAQILGCSKNTIGSQTSRALAHLRSRIADADVAAGIETRKVAP